MTKTEEVRTALEGVSKTDEQEVLKHLLISATLLAEQRYNRNAYSEKSETEQKAFEDFMLGIKKASKSVQDLFAE